jgi:hypothetical protein
MTVKLTQLEDGIELLRMSRKYNAHISLVANPLQLKIEGLQISTQKLEAHLKEITKVSSLLPPSLPESI